MKICNRCLIEQEETEFYRNGSYLRRDCKSCCYKRSQTPEYIIRNRQKNKNRYNIAKEYTRKAKEKPCIDCGIQYPHYVMQFDHVTNDKEFQISRGRGRKSLSVIQKEIEKCELVCANCHAERTWSRQQVVSSTQFEV